MSEKLKRPRPERVDLLVLEYAIHEAAAKGIAARLKLKQAERDAAEAVLVPLVLKFGEKHAQKSRRLKGLHQEATVTVGTRTVTVSEGVAKFLAYLVKLKLPQIRERFFTEHASYELVEGPAEVLKSLDLPKRVYNRIERMVRGCFDVKRNTPSLKVSVVVPEKF